MLSRRPVTVHNRGRVAGVAAPGNPYQPWVSESGAVLWFAADDPGVAQAQASIVDPTDLSTGNWTRVGMTAVGGTVTATAATATVQQVPANFSTGAMAWSTTFRVTYVSNGLSDWIAFELFANPVGRAWVNLSTGATGTIGSSLNVSVTPLGGNTYDITVTTHTSGGNYVMFYGASADNTLTCSVGWSTTIVTVSIAQTRCSAFLNVVSGASWAQATADLQPRFDATGFNGNPCLNFGGQQGIQSTEAAVLAACGVNNPDYTMFLVVSNVSGNSGTIFGAGASGTANNRTKMWGRTLTNTWRHQTISDAPATVSSVSTSGTYSAGSHLVVWSSSSGTISHRMDLAAQTLDVTTNSPNPLTATRVAIGERPDSVPDNRMTGLVASIGIWAGVLDAAAVGRVETYLKAKWGTP